MSTVPLSVENVDLGNRLAGIKNNHVVVNSPFTLSSSQVLGATACLKVLANGVQGITTGGNIALTFATGATLAAALPSMQVGQQISFLASSFSTAVNANTLTLLGNTGVTIAAGALSIVVSNQASSLVTLTCTGAALFVLGAV